MTNEPPKHYCTGCPGPTLGLPRQARTECAEHSRCWARIYKVRGDFGLGVRFLTNPGSRTVQSGGVLGAAHGGRGPTVPPMGERHGFANRLPSGPRGRGGARTVTLGLPPAVRLLIFGRAAHFLLRGARDDAPPVPTSAQAYWRAMTGHPVLTHVLQGDALFRLLVESVQ